MKLSPFLQNALHCIEEQPKTLEKQLIHDMSSFMTYFEENCIEKILLLGCGDSFYVAQAGELFLRILSPRIPTYSIEAAEYPYFNQIITSNTLIFAITASGRTIAVRNAVNEFKKLTKHIFLLTDVISVSESKNYRAVLSTETQGPYGLPPTKTTTSAMMLLFRLIAAIVAPENSEFNSHLISLPKLVEKNLQDKKLEQSLLDATKAAERIWFIGQGGGAIAALAGATKIHEFGSGRSSFCQLEEFAHHGILGVDSDDSVILVGNAALYTDMFIDAMKKIDISSYHLHLDEPILPLTYSEIFYPITHLIPLQKLALNLCIAKNLNPTFFRQPHASIFKIYS